AVTMGLLGYYYSTRSIFFFVALLSLPTVIALLAIRGNEIDYDRARGGTGLLQMPSHNNRAASQGLRILLRDHRLRIFLLMTILFHLGNGAMLALAGEIVALNATKKTDIWMGAFVTVPQIVMALIGPLVGKIADQRGRKPILVFGFIFLPLRAALFAL